ncbi:MAG: hypothetical protein JWM47_97 [Acidimicrobiales bacterium]|nr:hypothetical protein [Acidimicrobiales bacterium]
MTRRSRLGIGAFVGIGLALALAVAVFLTPLASSEPDGLERVSRDQGIGPAVAVDDAPDTPGAGAAVVGVSVTFVLAAGAAQVIRRRRATRTPAGDAGGARRQNAAGA